MVQVAVPYPMTVPEPADVSTTTDAPVATRRSVLAWWAVSAVAIVVIAADRVAETRRYFYWDDTQLGAFGQWYDLGRRLMSGQWTILDPGSWQGGNFLAEQQWGLWSPLVWVVGLGSHVQDNASLYATVVKVVFLVLLQTAVFGLARSHGASAPWAALAGVSAAVGGHTLYMDAPSWVTGLQGLALFALAWWMLRRHLEERRSPWAYFVAAFLLISLGYIFAVIALVFLFIALLLDAVLVARDRERVARILGLGVYSGLLTIFVYLPAVLTASVTVRSSSGIANDQFLGLDLGDLATGPAVTGLSSVAGYWGPIAPAPLQYLGWFLPLAVLLVPGLRHEWRRLLVVGLVGAAALTMVLGPTVVGPLRYPVRMLPYVVVCLVVVFAVLATKAWPRVVSRRQAASVLGLTVLSLWLAFSAQPDNMRWLAIGGLSQLVALALVMGVGSRVKVERVAGWASGIAIGATIVLLAFQVQLARNAPLGDFGIPSSVEAIQQVQQDSDSGVFTVGNVYDLQNTPDGWDETLLANVWHVTDLDSASVYTVLPHRELTRRLCVDLRGVTCPGAYERLFAQDRDGSTMVDDMHLNTIIVMKGDQSSVDAPVRPRVREGWTLQEGVHTWTVRRDVPVAPAGGVTRTVDAEVSDVQVRDTEVSFTVDDVGSGGGSVVLSRIDWPGYRVDGAVQGDSTNNYLMTVEVAPGDVGDRVTVSFRPPGWPVELASAALAAVLAIGWTLLHAVRARREAPTTSATPD